MQAQPSYPQSAYAPAPLVDLSDAAVRERLSPAAIKAFFNIMAKWAVKDADARDLLGGVSNGAFYEMKKNPNRVLDPDRLARISMIVGIFKSLNSLYPDDLADAWTSLPNSNRLFGGSTPLAYMRAGGLTALATVRRLVDARRGGL